MSGLELVPIGTILSLMIDQVITTAVAVNDVLIEKECFKTLSNYLFSIETIFVELQKHELNDTPALRSTLEFLKEDCEKAKGLVEKYKNRGRIYSLLFCRHIANEIQDVTRSIGKTLDTLPIGNSEILSVISHQVNTLQDEMKKAELVISQSTLTILEKLKNAIAEQKHDQNFRNSMLEQIATSAGVSKKPSEIIKELDSLRMENEEAATPKEMQEETFIKQVIELLTNADAVRDEEIRKYELIRSIVDKSEIRNGRIPEYTAHLCPITNKVMVDPVYLCSGTTCDRAAIESSFLEGNTTDPRSGDPLENLTLEPNISLRQSIQQWKEQNNFLKIKEAKEILQSSNSSAYGGALCELQKVINENMDTKFWIAMEGLIDIIVLLLGTSNGDLKSRSFQTLLDIVERHSHNKDKAVTAGILHHIVKCVGLDSSVCTAAVNLLFELLQENDRVCQAIPQEDCRWNKNFCRKLKQQHGTIAFLVVIVLDKQFSESAKKAEDILFQMCYNDDDTAIAAASYRWYKALVQRLCDGPESSKKLMLRGLEGMQLVDEDVKQLGKDGVINPLVKLAATDSESKELAFSLMAKLSISLDNRKFFVEARAFSLILEQIFSPQASPVIRQNCSGIFEMLTSNGMEFLTGLGIVDQELLITNLLGMLSNPSSPIGSRKPVFRALLSICNSAKAAAEEVIARGNGISSILPLIKDSDKEIQELALQFLYQFSQDVAIGTDFLLDGNRLETFMSFLKDDNQPGLQILAVGILAKLQNTQNQLIKRLADLTALPVLMNILEKGTMEARENVLDLLKGFMNPTNTIMQKSVVDYGVYRLLVDILRSGSKTAKARAAALIGNLSSSSPTLTTKPPNRSWFCFPSKKAPGCEVHGGICSVESSFCLLESKALLPLVKLLQENDDAVKLSVVQTLKTLFQQGCGSRAAKVLHENQAIVPMLYILCENNQTLVREVLDVLEVVFADKEVAKKYNASARSFLIQVYSYHTENTNADLWMKAESILKVFEQYSNSGSMPG